MTNEELAALVGHRFPGGTYRVAHWENWLLTDCTGREPMPEGLVHPIVLFHAPILGAGTSIGELFRLGGVSGAGGSVGLEGYDWEYFHPLREEIDYRVEGGIVSAERHVTESGSIIDRVAFGIELFVDTDAHQSDARTMAARVTNRWIFRRGEAGQMKASPEPASGTDAGELLPSWTMPAVDAARMKTMAALLRDPYPVHWDREANATLGLGGRVINQGPLNLGYVANMLMAWAGPAAIRRLRVSFGRPVLDGDNVVACGRVVNIQDGIASCDVWLDRDGERVVTGTADVVAPRP
jgi:acyl dehydratase